jgi:hypothetical protein
MDDQNMAVQPSGDQRQSFFSRNAASIWGIGAFVLMVLATLFTMLR